MTLCVRYGDVMNGTRQPFRSGSAEEVAYMRDLQKKITIEQVFQWTPPEAKIMEKCMFRKPMRYFIHDWNTSMCYEHFIIRKFYIQEAICYQFTINHTHDFTTNRYHYQNLAHPLSYPGVFYGVFLNATLLIGADVCKVCISSKDDSPLNSVPYAPYFNRRLKERDKYNMVGAAFHRTSLHSLPPPYKTRCRTYEEFHNDKRRCFNDCLKYHGIKELGKVPFSVVVSESRNLRHICSEDLENETIVSEIHRVERFCSSECKEPGCIKKFFKTVLQIEERGEHSEVFTILVQTPRSPFIRITHIPKLDLTEYLVYISSCFGTWFGLSIISLNPAKLQSHWLKRRAQKNAVARHTCPPHCRKMMQEYLKEVQLLKQMVNTSKAEK